MSLPALYVPQAVGDAADPATTRRVIEYLRAAAEVAGAKIEAQDDEKIVLSAPSIRSVLGSYRTLTIRVRQDHGALVCEAEGNRSMGMVWLQVISAACMGTASIMVGHAAGLKTGILAAFMAFSAWQTFQASRRQLTDWLSITLERVAANPAMVLPSNPSQRHDIAKMAAQLHVSGRQVRRRVRVSLLDGSTVTGHMIEVTPGDITIQLNRRQFRQIPLSAIATIDGAVSRAALVRTLAWGYAGTVMVVMVSVIFQKVSTPTAARIIQGLVGGGVLLGAATAALWRKWLTKWERWFDDKPA